MKSSTKSDFELIVGGSEEKPNSWPWAVGIFRNGRYFCGGTIINQHYILTAAHCVGSRNASTYKVLVGAHRLHGSGWQVPVELVVRHKSFDDARMNNDIALLRLKDALDFSTSKVSPVCLPTKAMDDMEFNGTKSVVVGWGHVREGGSVSSTLQEVNIPILTNKECAKVYGNRMISESQLCAADQKGGYDSCQVTPLQLQTLLCMTNTILSSRVIQVVH